MGKEMLKAGYATVYEAKTGAEFGEFEENSRRSTERKRRERSEGRKECGQARQRRTLRLQGSSRLGQLNDTEMK